MTNIRYVSPYILNDKANRCLVRYSPCHSHQKFLTLAGGSKCFGTHITEKPPRHLVRIVFWSTMGPNGPKMPIFGQKNQLLANLAVYRPKILIIMGVSKSFGTPITEKPPRQLCELWIQGWVFFQIGELEIVSKILSNVMFTANPSHHHTMLRL